MLASPLVPRSLSPSAGMGQSWECTSAGSALRPHMVKSKPGISFDTPPPQVLTPYLGVEQSPQVQLRPSHPKHPCPVDRAHVTTPIPAPPRHLSHTQHHLESTRTNDVKSFPSPASVTPAPRISCTLTPQGSAHSYPASSHAPSPAPEPSTAPQECSAMTSKYPGSPLLTALTESRSP